MRMLNIGDEVIVRGDFRTYPATILEIGNNDHAALIGGDYFYLVKPLSGILRYSRWVKDYRIIVRNNGITKRNS